MKISSLEDVPTNCPKCSEKLSEKSKIDDYIPSIHKEHYFTCENSILFNSDYTNISPYSDYLNIAHFWIVFDLNWKIKRFQIEIEPSRLLRWSEGSLYIKNIMQNRYLIENIECPPPNPFNYSELANLYNNLLLFS